MTLQEFLAEWHSASPFVKVRTSGSTGTPKEMLVEKARMQNSARMTCSFLKLAPADKALLCMPLDYIAGKMMAVRAVECGLELVSVAPSSHPLAGLEVVPNFAAMTPMQVACTMENPVEKELFCKIRTVIIGGGAISAGLEAELRLLPNEVWSTYGMTETLSHIALRRVSGQAASLWYTPLEGISLSLSADSTLVIDAPMLHDGVLQTNDIVELNETGDFRIIGRRDNTVNSGGVKIQLESVEEQIRQHCPSVPFVVTSRPDELLGEMLVALLPENTDEMAKKQFFAAFAALPRYWRPKKVVLVESLPLTETGKPDRARAKVLANS
jgi:O-succinylbenzoic acid--CoA ligase